VGIEAAFETFGANCLKEAIDSTLNLVVLDEIGRFESNSKNFIQQLHNVFDSHKTVIAVIKKEPIAFIEDIKTRNDILLLDLDLISPDDVFHRVLSVIETQRS
jgi:nucleoside-triphosphatase